MKKLDQYSISLIEQYLLKTLDKNGLETFNQKLKSDEAFAEAFKVEQDIHQCILYMEDQTTRAYLEQLYSERKEKGLLETKITNTEESPKEKKDNVRNMYSYLRYAAAILLLCGLIALYFFLGNEPSANQLFASNYAIPTWSETVRGETDTKAIKTAYETRDFNQVLVLTENTTEDSKLQLYKGISQLELGQTTAAIETFNQLKTNEAFNDQATWYLAMSYLKADDKENCKTQLRMLTEGTIETSDNMRSKAAKLLGKL